LSSLRDLKPFLNLLFHTENHYSPHCLKLGSLLTAGSLYWTCECVYYILWYTDIITCAREYQFWPQHYEIRTLNDKFLTILYFCFFSCRLTCLWSDTTNFFQYLVIFLVATTFCKVIRHIYFNFWFFSCRLTCLWKDVFENLPYQRRHFESA
jgi:hypothetical protein